MAVRLTSEFRVRALIRLVHDAGGSAMVLAKGDAMAGAILVMTVHRGAGPRFHERGLTASGATSLIASGPTSGDSADADDYWQRRCRNDPDLWVVEVDVADPERFAAETIAAD